MNEQTLQARLQLLEDERDIRALIAHLAASTDARALNASMAAWTDDAVYEMPGVFRREGAAAIRAAMSHRWSGAAAGIAGVPPSSVAERHHVTDTRIIIQGDTAQAVSTYIAVHAQDKEAAFRASGLYEDRLVRTAQGWKLCERRLTGRIP